MLTLIAQRSRLDLDVVGYQFPALVDGEWDSEWLQVAAVVEQEGKRWKFLNPCLTTFELASLAAWLRNVPLRSPERELGFTEPNIRFQHVEGVENDHLCVWFSQGSSPPWATEHERFGGGVAIHIPFSEIDFSAAANSVENLCRRFPERASRHGA